MFNITLMTIVSLVTIGIVEFIKVFLPENAGSKIKGMISLIISIAGSIGFGVLLNYDTRTIILSTVGTVGLVHCYYDFILKLLKSKIEQIKLKIEEEAIQIPLIEKKIEDELERLSNGDKSNESPVEK